MLSNMIKTIIIDDESKGRTILKTLLEKYCRNVEVLELADSAENGIIAIKKHKPDLIFLDIEMPHENGFDMLKKLDLIDFEVIFVTAFDHYAVKAFKFSATDYLLKPIDAEELITAVSRVESKIQKKPQEKMEVLFNNLRSFQNPYNKIGIPTRDGIIFIPINEVIRCESEINYTRFYLQKGEKMLASKTLKEFEELLTEYNFFRVHKSHLINLHHIKRYVKGEGGTVILSDNSEVEVSRRNKEQFLKRLGNL